MRLYLAGKMLGLSDHGFTAFNVMAAKLRSQGHDVFNPAENAGALQGAEAEQSLGRPYYMRMDILAIVGGDCVCGHTFKPVDAIVVLRGWETSRGARLEIEIAQQLDIPILWADGLEPLSEEDIDNALMYIDPSYLRPDYKGVAA